MSIDVSKSQEFASRIAEFTTPILGGIGGKGRAGNDRPQVAEGTAGMLRDVVASLTKDNHLDRGDIKLIKLLLDVIQDTQGDKSDTVPVRRGPREPIDRLSPIDASLDKVGKDIQRSMEHMASKLPGSAGDGLKAAGAELAEAFDKLGDSFKTSLKEATRATWPKMPTTYDAPKAALPPQNDGDSLRLAAPNRVSGGPVDQAVAKFLAPSTKPSAEPTPPVNARPGPPPGVSSDTPKLDQNLLRVARSMADQLPEASGKAINDAAANLVKALDGLPHARPKLPMPDLAKVGQDIQNVVNDIASKLPESASKGLKDAAAALAQSFDRLSAAGRSAPDFAKIGKDLQAAINDLADKLPADAGKGLKEAAQGIAKAFEKVAQSMPAPRDPFAALKDLLAKLPALNDGPGQGDLPDLSKLGQDIEKLVNTLASRMPGKAGDAVREAGAKLAQAVANATQNATQNPPVSPVNPNPTAGQPNSLSDVLKSVITSALADGRISDSENKAISAVLDKMGGKSDLSVSDLLAQVTRFSQASHADKDFSAQDLNTFNKLLSLLPNERTGSGSATPSAPIQADAPPVPATNTPKKHMFDYGDVYRKLFNEIEIGNLLNMKRPAGTDLSSQAPKAQDRTS
jgi:hypothetical protein